MHILALPVHHSPASVPSTLRRARSLDIAPLPERRACYYDRNPNKISLAYNRARLPAIMHFRLRLTLLTQHRGKGIGVEYCCNNSVFIRRGFLCEVALLTCHDIFAIDREIKQSATVGTE